MRLLNDRKTWLWQLDFAVISVLKKNTEVRIKTFSMRRYAIHLTP